MRQEIRRCFFGSLMWFLCLCGPMVAEEDPAGTDQSRRHTRFIERRDSILGNLHFQLNEISDWCREQGMTDATEDLSELARELSTDGAVATLPATVRLPLSPALPDRERQWRERVLRIRSEKARELYSLARSTLRARLPSLAYQVIQDVLRLDPDHRNSRAILQQQLFHDPLRKDDATYAGEWVSPFEAKLRSGRQPHIRDDRFGWIPRRHLARYESGERPWKGSWISKEKDAELRRDFRNAWEIRSEHFLVRTNVSLEEGVLLSRRLEQFYFWLTQNFAAFFDTPKALQERFENAHVRRRRRSAGEAMEVHYFASRAEYDRRIRGKVPPDIVTNGLYWQPDQRCYFFPNEDGTSLSTLYHEATHQILDIPTTAARRTTARSLARRTQRPVQEWILGGQSGFWVIEGLACYFESFAVTDGMIAFGRPDFVRFVAAQQRLLREDLHFYLPLQIFCGLGKDNFQHHPNVAQLYSQASGLAHFMMHYGNGRYRDDLVRLLAALYRPDPKNPQRHLSLSEITGTPFGVLDQEYREHIENLAERVQSLAERQDDRSDESGG